MKLEVCANSYQSAKNAQEAGAQRIELCQNLVIGGITPTDELLKKAIQELDIETFVLIRPRGGDFCYSETEFNTMRNSIELCKSLGHAGIVSGVLNEDNTLDIKRTKALVELSRPLQFTFHRAFDEVPNPLETMEQLIDLGVERILTSGQEHKAEEGFKLLKELKERAKGRIIIMPGSGINPANAKLFKKAGFSEIHASASKPIDNNQTVSDLATIKAILDEI
ncbi:copper homeostasis protein CutC [Winogradskyella sp. 3972H.M.0a.05]|uniref:copper homeostasis protein CutC n=1 Tax=Winogradskyella sp. 3972H.M.0a.05 TaxID=2950277 RepID=UPI003395E2EE